MSASLVVPSIPYISYQLFLILSRHPLFLKPLVLHPVNLSAVPISVYRFMDGFPIGLESDTIACCIIPASSDSDPLSSPHTYNVSALYKPFVIGQDYDEVIYHMGIKFYYQEVTLPGLNITTDKDLTKVPTEGLISPSQRMLTPLSNKQVQLEINPGFEIIGNYLELARLAFLDSQFVQSLNFAVKSVEVVHQNLPSSKWDHKTNVFLQHGDLMLRITAFISRGWKEKFQVPITDFNLTLSDPNNP